jgi:hypothetical protein
VALLATDVLVEAGQEGGNLVSLLSQFDLAGLLDDLDVGVGLLQRGTGGDDLLLEG